MTEYYKCINANSAEDCFTLNKIYKIRNPEDLEHVANFIDDNGASNGWSGNNYKHFEPSTEYEYNEQNNISNIKKDVDYSYLISFFDKFNTI
jgi:hypothetical protein